MNPLCFNATSHHSKQWRTVPMRNRGRAVACCRALSDDPGGSCMESSVSDEPSAGGLGPVSRTDLAPADRPNQKAKTATVGEGRRPTMRDAPAGVHLIARTTALMCVGLGSPSPRPPFLHEVVRTYNLLAPPTEGRTVGAWDRRGRTSTRTDIVLSYVHRRVLGRGILERPRLPHPYLPTSRGNYQSPGVTSFLLTQAMGVPSS